MSESTGGAFLGDKISSDRNMHEELNTNLLFDARSELIFNEQMTVMLHGFPILLCTQSHPDDDPVLLGGFTY